MCSDYCTFCLARLIHIVIYLLIVYHYGLLRYLRRNSRDSGLLNLTGPLPVFHHRRSYAQKAKSKLSTIRKPRDRHAHNSLSNVVIHMPHLALTSIVQGIINWKWFFCMFAYLGLQWVTHCTDLTAISCFCSKIKRHT